MAARFGPGRAGAFHETKRGKRIKLSENNSVAERAGHWDSGDGVHCAAYNISVRQTDETKCLHHVMRSCVHNIMHINTIIWLLYNY